MCSTPFALAACISFFSLRRRKQQTAIKARSAKNARAPMTIPAMAPPLRFRLVDGDPDEVDVFTPGEADGVAVDAEFELARQLVSAPWTTVKMLL